MKYLLSAFLTGLFLQSMACNPEPLPTRWSAGIIGIGNYQLPYDGWHPYFLPGIQVKRECGNYAIRAGVEHVKTYIAPSEQGGFDILYMSGPVSRTLFRAGAERSWKLHRWFNPYAAADIAWQSMHSDITSVGGIAGLNERVEIDTRGIGLLPAIGLRSELGKNISLFAEYRAEAFLNDESSKLTDYNGNVDSRPSRRTDFDFSAGKSVQAGIQIYF